MDDLISRQAAIDAILHNQEVYSNNYGNDPIDKYTIAIIDNDAQTVAQLPSAQPEPKWIPCSERLPEDSSPVLITHRGGVSYGWYNGRYFERGANTNHRKLQTVIAWMPLPEPWKGEAE